MTGSLRVQYEETAYQVMARGSSLGFSGGISGFGGGATAFVNVAVDSSGNIGVTYGGGFGQAIGAGLAGGVSYQSSNAATIQDLEGPFVNQSVSVADGGSATADTFEGAGNTDSGSGTVIGAGATAGVGLGGSAFNGVTNTWESPAINLGDIANSIGSFFSGGGSDTPGTNTDPGVYDNPGSNYEPSGSPKDPNVHNKARKH